MLHSLHHRKLGSTYDGSKLIVGHVDGPFKGLVVPGAKRGCFAIGARVSGAEGGWASITTVQDTPPQSQSRFLRWRISPRWSRRLDFLAQMNLVLDILRMPFGDMM